MERVNIDEGLRQYCRTVECNCGKVFKRSGMIKKRALTIEIKNQALRNVIKGDIFMVLKLRLNKFQ